MLRVPKDPGLNIRELQFTSRLFKRTSFPKESPDATASARPRALISRVHGVKNAVKT